MSIFFTKDEQYEILQEFIIQLKIHKTEEIGKKGGI